MLREVQCNSYCWHYFHVQSRANFRIEKLDYAFYQSPDFSIFYFPLAIQKFERIVSQY